MDRNMNGTVRNEEALGRFLTTITEIDGRLMELKGFIDGHMFHNPEEINWAHVGMAECFLKVMTELTDIAYNRGEYGE